jgi:hypothetical protein
MISLTQTCSASPPRRRLRIGAGRKDGHRTEGSEGREFRSYHRKTVENEEDDDEDDWEGSNIPSPARTEQLTQWRTRISGKETCDSLGTLRRGLLRIGTAELAALDSV